MKKHELADRVAAAVMREIKDAGTIERSRSFLPITSDRLIPPGTHQIVARPQVAFRGDRLAVWSVCAPSFFSKTSASATTARALPQEPFLPTPSRRASIFCRSSMQSFRRKASSRSGSARRLRNASANRSRCL